MSASCGSTALLFSTKVSILPGTTCHTVANLRSEQGELLDEQLTFVLVELPVTAVQSGLHKLLYPMKTLHTVTEPTKYPAFWNEEWLRRALDELNTRNMTPEERAASARVTATNAEAVKAERRRVEQAMANGLR